ncbi:unnamed protein product [Rhizoctonia solani]|uniref:Uncharacterized protein n=1 Tax=Rhizoctonia solani TaxID=456999 RepID=A0A8H2WBH1_9AGAM|nr:unnamed protein product [Rhizoctonia solani]
MITLTPPQIPAYLAGAHELRPIVGKPTEEQVKTIHAVIRDQNSVSHVPALNDPDLSMKLSQHLFDVQMAIYQSNYSVNPSSEAKNIYVPPKLPPGVPGELHQIVGPPTDEQVKSVQSVIRYVESQSHARYKQYSTCNILAPDISTPSSIRSGLNQGRPPHEENLPSAPRSETPAELLAGFDRMERVMKELHETMKESKNVLENVNRVLVSTQRSQTMVGSFDQNTKSTVHMNPVNNQGILATELGLPLLRYWLTGEDYILWMDKPAIARYLDFFEIGSDLIHGGDNPVLISGMEDKATKLLFKHIGIHYNSSQRYRAQVS